MSSLARICLWSGPRNISTALMYSFAQRPQCKVFDEPLYAHYLSNISDEKKAKHPMCHEILSIMENNGERVVDFMTGNFPDGVTEVFFKNMAHHILDLDLGFTKDLVNVILTRNPEDMIPSFDKVIEQPSLQDVGYKAHLDLIEELQQLGASFVVVESRDILENPEIQLRRICDAAEIEFLPEMLYWEAGARVEDGIWAPYWYNGTHASTGFQEYKPKPSPFPERLIPLLEECRPHFEKIITYKE